MMREVKIIVTPLLANLLYFGFAFYDADTDVVDVLQVAIVEDNILSQTLKLRVLKQIWGDHNGFAHV